MPMIRSTALYLAASVAALGCATPQQAPVFREPHFATLDVAIGEMYGDKLVRIGSRGFRLKIDGLEVKPQPKWNESCVARFGKRMVCDLGSKDIYGTEVTKFDIKPGNHIVQLCKLGDCAAQEVDFNDEYHTQTIGFVYHFKEYEYRKVAQYQGISWHGKFEKNKYDSYIEPVSSEKGMKKLLDAINELKKPPVPKQPKIRPGSAFEK